MHLRCDAVSITGLGRCIETALGALALHRERSQWCSHLCLHANAHDAYLACEDRDTSCVCVYVRVHVRMRVHVHASRIASLSCVQVMCP